MKERPILFSPGMVRAILDGRKTQTRRLIKPQPTGEMRPISEWSRGLAAACHDRSPDTDKLTEHSNRLKGKVFPFATDSGGLMSPTCPYGQPGDRLWVRESWAVRLDQDHLSPSQLPHGMTVGYWADGPGKCCNTGCAGAAGRVRASIHMPRWASRILLEITNVRVARIQDISTKDALAEGQPTDSANSPVVWFMSLWDSINSARGYGWKVNPFVWVIEFKRIGK